MILVALFAQGCSNMRKEVPLADIKRISSSGRDIEGAITQLRYYGFNCDDFTSKARIQDFPKGTRLIYICNYSAITGLLSARETQVIVDSTDTIKINESIVSRNQIST